MFRELIPRELEIAAIPALLVSLESLEGDLVVELLFGLATVTDKKVTKDELLKDDDLPAGYAE